MERGPFRVAAGTMWVLTLLVVGFCVPTSAQADRALSRPTAQVEWTQDRFDAAHDGFNPYETKIRAKTVKNLRFVFGMDGNFVSSPIEVSGILDIPYSGRIDGRTLDGAPVWSTQFKDGVVARPAGSDGTIYVPTPTTLYEVDALTGAITDRWTNTPSSGEVVLTDDSIYVHTTSQLTALDRQGHQVRWTHSVSAEAIPAVSGGIVYEPVASGQLVALDASTGTVVWGPVTSTGNPSVADGMVFTNGGGAVRAFDALTGALKWSVSVPSGPGIPAEANGVVYVVLQDPDIVEAIDDASGAPIWMTKIANGGGAATTITLVNSLVFASIGSGVYVLNKRGTELARLVTYRAWNGGSGVPVVNGHVYFYGCGKRCAFAAWAV